MKTPNTKFYAKALFQAVLLALATTIAISLMVDRFAGTPEIVTGYVIEKQFESAINSTLERKATENYFEKVRKDNDSNDAYLLIVFTNGNSTAVACEADYFFSASLGQEVKYISQRGYLTGWYWTKELIY